MKVVILAGGRGTRISEESHLRPKPMIEIGGEPILWHIMKIYSAYGYQDFIVCCGYKGQLIKKYFLNYHTGRTDITFKLDEARSVGKMKNGEPWKVTLANTGLDTKTAGRVLRIRDYVGEDEEFMLTYGDGVADINVDQLLDFHHKNNKIATITTTQPAGRFGAIRMDGKNGRVYSFKEKARVDQGWVNAGFMVLNRQIFDYLGDGSEMLEAGPFEKLSGDGEMMAYRHNGFWSPMDTMRDKEFLEKLWNEDKAPWKIW